MDYEVIVDGQSLKELVFFTTVDRTMGPPVKNRVIKIKGYILRDVLKVVDVLNKLMTGDLQSWIFTDQPDRFWRGRLKSGVQPSSCERLASVTFEVEVPDGVAYSIQPKVIRTDKKSVFVENNGSHTCYPTFDFSIKGLTHMVSVVSKDAVFQYGEPLDASPLKKIKFSRTKIIDGHEGRRQQSIVDDYWKNLATDQSYDISKINGRWVTSGEWNVLVSGGETEPSGNEITVADWATHWQTGEPIDDWVKGQTFSYTEVKDVNQSKSTKAYLLTNEGYYLGWLLSQDIANGGVTSSTSDDCSPDYGSSSGYKWHGPVMRYKLESECTNFDASTWLNFYVDEPERMGAFYFAVMANERVIGAIQFSSHQENMMTFIDFIADGSGVQTDNYDMELASRFWGRLRIVKQDDQILFEVLNDQKKQTFSRSFTVSSLKDVVPTHILVWAGQYADYEPAYEVSVNSVGLIGYDTKVWIEPESKEVEDFYNLPDPSTTVYKGDMVRLCMENNKGYINGIPDLTPIQYGSQSVGIPPGRHQLFFPCSGEGQPTVEIRYREVFR